MTTKPLFTISWFRERQLSNDCVFCEYFIRFRDFIFFKNKLWFSYFRQKNWLDLSEWIIYSPFIFPWPHGHQTSLYNQLIQRKAVVKIMFLKFVSLVNCVMEVFTHSDLHSPFFCKIFSLGVTPARSHFISGLKSRVLKLTFFA